MRWICCFSRLAAATDLSKVKLIAGSGQQHGSVYLDATFDARLAALDPRKASASQIAPALTRATSPIWMDTSTGAECAEITAALGGSGGSLPPQRIDRHRALHRPADPPVFQK